MAVEPVMSVCIMDTLLLTESWWMTRIIAGCLRDWLTVVSIVNIFRCNLMKYYRMTVWKFPKSYCRRWQRGGAGRQLGSDVITDTLT